MTRTEPRFRRLPPAKPLLLDRRPRRPAALAPVLLSTILALAAEARPLAAQNPRWSASGPSCTPVLAVAFAGARSKRAYAASVNDPAPLFVSNDYGASWKPVERQPRIRSWQPIFPIFDIDVDPADDRVLWLAASQGVLKSEDRGRTWKQLNQGFPDAAAAWDLEIHPTDPDVMHTIADAQLYRTSNGGRRWRQISAAGFILDYAVDPRDPDRVWISDYDGLARTTNGGRRWTAASDGPTEGGPLALDPTASSTLYTAVRGEIYRTTDGRRWEPLGRYGIDAGVEANFLSLDPSRPSDLLLGVYSGDGDEPGLWRSTDGGTSWNAMGLVGEETSSVARHPGKPKITLIGTTDSLYRSRKGGRKPNLSQTGLFGGPVDGLAVAPAAEKAISYATTSCGLFARVEREAAWNRQDRSRLYDGSALAASPADPRLVYRGLRRRVQPSHSVDVSADGGSTWMSTLIWLSGSEARAIQVSPADPARVYVSVKSLGLYVSRDGGASWTRPLEGSTLGLTPSVIAPHPTDAETVYANGRGIVKSGDGGASWQQIADLVVHDLAIDPTRPDTIYAVGSQLHRSRNGGASWKVISLDLPARAELHSVAVDGAGGTVFVGHTFGVLRSTDGGRTWKTFDKGLPRDLEIDRDARRILAVTPAGELLLATDHGVYVTRAR